LSKLPKKAELMLLPVFLQFLDCASERLIQASVVYGRFILASIGVQSVAMSESVSIVIAYHGQPLVFVLDFELYGKANDLL